MSQQHDTINVVERQKGSSHSSEELTPTVQQVVDELIAALTQGGQAVLAAETTLEGVLAAVGEARTPRTGSAAARRDVRCHAPC